MYRQTQTRHEAGSGLRPPAPPPARILVLSDLHMGAGARPGEGVDPLEHFFHDDELAALIERVARRCGRRGQHCALVLNGDVFDFVRIVRLPGSTAEVDAWGSLLARARVAVPAEVLEDARHDRFSALERRYGLDSAEHEAVWKLQVMSQGHARIFRALARWCAAGHELVVIRGNHDVEFAWPGVRRALRVLLEDFGAGPLRRGQLRFRMRRWRRRNLVVEHGHIVRWSTHADGLFTRGRRRRLKQPFGSYINRFILNPVERLLHLPPGMPSSLHLKHQLRSDPFRLWRGLLRHAFRATPRVGRATWGIWHRHAHGWWPTRIGIALGAGVLLLPLFSSTLVSALSLESARTRAGAALLVLAVPHLGLALFEIVGTVRDDTSRRARAHAARLALAGERRGTAADRVVILGHTHRPELLGWDDQRGRVTYANPGCWLGEGDTAGGCVRFVWAAWNGQRYSRARVLEIEGRAGRCRTHSRS